MPHFFVLSVVLNLLRLASRFGEPVWPGGKALLRLVSIGISDPIRGFGCPFSSKFVAGSETG